MDLSWSLLIKALKIWVPVAALATVLAGLVFGTVQADIWRSANDPQVQLAEDAAARLDAGAAPRSVVPPGVVDMVRSPAPYTIVFDSSGRPLASSALLHGKVPAPPQSAFAVVRGGGQDLMTWTPAQGVRMAAVLVSYKGGYVLAGRSLSSIEQREAGLRLLALAGWLAALVATGVATLVAAIYLSRLERTLTRPAPGGAA